MLQYGPIFAWCTYRALLLSACVVLIPKAEASQERVKWQASSDRQVYKQLNTTVQDNDDTETGQKLTPVAEQQQTIIQILKDHREKRISYAQAKQALKPIIQEQMEKERATAGIKKEYLTQELVKLDELVKNPQAAVERRLKELMGMEPAAALPATVSEQP